MNSFQVSYMDYSIILARITSELPNGISELFLNLKYTLATLLEGFNCETLWALTGYKKILILLFPEELTR